MPWSPRSPFEQLEGCIFLGRIIDKARRVESGEPIGEYMYGDNDYMDSRVFRHLRTNATRVTGLVRTETDDSAVARTVVNESGKSPQQLQAFNRRMLMMYGPVFVMFDADEGRNTGFVAQLLSAFYNRVIYPPFAAKFRRDEARRTALR